MTTKPNNTFAQLCDAVGKRSLEVTLPMIRKNGHTSFRIELRSPDKPPKILDYEDVRQTENIEKAALRMHERLRRQRVVEA